MTPLLRVVPVLVLWICLFGNSASAQSCTGHVNASDGDDGNPGTLTAPLRSISAAFQAFPSDSRVCVAAGEYFLGADSSGIRLSGSSKSMTFEMRPFAGSSEVLLSEGVLEVDAGSGVVSFVGPSGSSLRLGAGVTNRLGIAPLRHNSLHSLILASGTLDVTGVTTVIEASVGSPDFVNSVSPGRVPPDDARVEFRDGMLVGSPTWEPAARSVLVSGTLASMDYNGPRDIDTGALRVTADGVVVFPDPIETRSPVHVSQPSGGGALFEGGLVWGQPTIPSDSLLMVSGEGALHISALSLVGSDAGSGRLLLRTTGESTIEGVTNADSRPILIELSAGTLSLGSPAGTLRLDGALIDGTANLQGPVEVGGSGRPGVFGNSGIVNLGPHTLTFLPSVTQAENTGQIAASEGQLVLETDLDILGAGSLPSLLVSNDAGIYAARITGSVSINPGGRFRPRAGFLNVTGDIQGTGTVDFEAMDSVRVQGNLNLSSASLAIGPSQVIVESSVHLLGSAVTTTTGGLRLFGAAPRSLSAQDTILPRVEIAGGMVSLSGRIDIAGPLDFISGDHTLGADALVSVAGSTLIGTGILALGDGAGLNVEEGLSISGTMTLGRAANLLVGGTGSIGQDGSVSTSEDARISFGVLLNQGGSLTMDSGGELTVSGDLLTDTGTLDLATASLLLDGTGPQTVRFSEASLGHLVLPSEGGLVRVHGVLRVTSDVLLDRGALVLAENARIEASGSLIVSGPRLDCGPGAVLALVGTGIRTIEAGDHPLCGLEVDGPFSTLVGEIRVAERLDLRIGSLTVAEAATLTAVGPMDIGGGLLRISSGALLNTTSTVTIESGTLSLEGEWTATGDILASAGTLDLGRGTLRTAPTTSLVLELPFQTTVEKLLAVTGRADIRTPTQLLVEDSLWVHAGASLDSGSATIVAAPTATVIADGALRLSEVGALHVTSSATRLTGGGRLDNLTLQLPDSSSVLLVPGEAAFALGGRVDLTQGRIDLSGSQVTFATPPPEIIYHLTSAGGGATAAGRLLVGTRTDLGTFDLTIRGELRTFFDPTSATSIGNVRTLHASALDSINPIPVFGIALPDSLHLSGGLEIASGALVRLGRKLTVGSDGGTTSIRGRLSGSGSVLVSGGRVELQSESPTVPAFVFQPPSSAVLAGSGRIRQLSFLSGSTHVESSGLEVVEALVIDQASVQLAGTLGIQNRASVLAGTLDLSPESLVRVGTGARFESFGQINLVDPTEPGGILEMAGGSSLAAASVPQLRVAPADAAASVSLEFDTVVEVGLDHSRGNLLLNGFSLDVRGTWTSGSAGSGSVPKIVDSAGAPGVTLVDGVLLQIHGALELVGAPLRIRQSAGSTTRVWSTAPGARLLVRNQSADLQGGTLHLDQVDLMIEGSSSSLLTANSITITGTGSPRQLVSPGKHLDGEFAPPYSDADFSELVLTGVGSGVINMGPGVSIDHLRVDRTVFLQDGASPVRVTRRLVFGQGGASIVASDGLLDLGPDAAIVRRGNGALTGTPTFRGATGVFYDLGSGLITGHDTAFGAGTLLSGPELRGGMLRELVVVAGRGMQGPNRLVVTSHVEISERLLVVSGQLDLGDSRVTLAESSLAGLYGLDPETLPGITARAGGMLSSFPVNLLFSSLRSNLFSDNASFPSTLPVDTLYIDFGGAQPGEVSEFILHANRTVGNLHVDNDQPGSSLNLNGVTLDVTGKAILTSGRVYSPGVANLTVNGRLDVEADAIVSGAVLASVSGDAAIAGAFDALSLSVGGDLTVPGHLSSTASLAFVGQRQKLTFADNLEVSELAINQSGSLPSVTLDCLSGCPHRLSVGRLILTNGLLQTGPGSIFLSGAEGAYTRNVPDGARSHVVGTVTRETTSGSNATIAFPTGTSTQYTPISLGFSGGILADASFSVVSDSTLPIGVTGLPFADPNMPVVSLPPLTVFSSVDFADAQLVDVTVASEDGATGLVTRWPATSFAPWQDLGGDLDTSATLDGLPAIRLPSVRRILSPRGIQLGVRREILTTAASRSEIRLFNATPETFFSIHEGPLTLHESLAFGDSAISAAFAGETGDITTQPLTIASSATTWRLPFVLPPDALVGVAVASSGSALEILESEPLPTRPSSPDAVAVGVFNGTHLPVTVRVGNRDLTSSLEPLSWSGSAEIPDDGVDVELRVGETTGTVPLDWSALRGQSVLLVVGKSSRGITPLVVLGQDGAATTAAVPTSVGSPDHPPAAFVLHQNYPNPFNLRTTISYDLAAPANVTLEVFEVTGRRVYSQRYDHVPAGRGHTLSFDGSGLASGLYFYRVGIAGEAHHESAVKSFLLLR